MKNIQQPQILQQSPKKSSRQIDPLQKYLKNQKTYFQQYQIIKEMITLVANKMSYNLQSFKKLYHNLSPQIKNTILFCQLNYMIWNDEAFPLQIRQKTQFFKIVSEWIVLYELKVADLKNFSKQIQFLHQFFDKNTKSIFEKVVLFDQISEDLIQLLGKQFWALSEILGENEQRISGTKQQAACFLKFIATLVQYEWIYYQQKQQPVHHCQLYLLRKKSESYKQFILRSLQFSLNVNNSKKPPQKCLQKHQQMQLTRIALVFLQRPDIIPEQAIKILQLLMLKTAKAVRYAMVVDYVRYYDYLEKQKQYQILQQLENMVYFRQLIIGQTQVTQSALFTNPMSSQPVQVTIPSRNKHRILLSHQKQLFGKYSILQLQFMIEAGDITVTINTMKNSKQVQYWKQERTEDRRIDILLVEEGLYILQFDNRYSWMKGKKVSYRMQQYCAGVHANTNTSIEIVRQ